MKHDLKKVKKGNGFQKGKTIKEKRLEKRMKKSYILVSTTLILSYWTNLFLTFDKSIAENKLFCQENLLTLLLFIVISILFIKFNYFVNTKEDIKSMLSNLKINAVMSLCIINLTLLAQIIENIFKH